MQRGARAAGAPGVPLHVLWDAAARALRTHARTHTRTPPACTHARTHARHRPAHHPPPQVQGSDLDIEQILAEVDKDGNGVIDYEEFCAMMRAGLGGGEDAIPAVRGQGAGLAGVLGA